MTTSQETMTDAARRGQEAITCALQIWADSVHRFVPMSDTKLRGAVEAVDTMFDFAEQMLVTQREFTKSLLAATTSATTKATSAAHDAALDVKDAANGQRQPEGDLQQQPTMSRRPSSGQDADAAAKKY